MAERTAENRNQGPLCKSLLTKTGLKHKTPVYDLIDTKQLKKEVDAGAEYFWSQPHREGIKPIKIDSNDFLFKWTSKTKGKTSFWQ